MSKLAADDYAIRLWHERMVALGVTIDSNLRENVAMHAENKDMLANLCEEAKKVAKSNLAADRGSQKHRVLELILTGQEQKLITDQQRSDAVILKRTLDRYKLVPHGELAEQFVIYPEYTVCGRFDAVLDFEKPDGSTVLVDLKSGENAVFHPQSTLAQLAMYANAEHISTGEHRGDRVEVYDWTTMPTRLDRGRAFVLLVTNDAPIGTLWECNIEHGMQAARLALDLLNWRKQFDYAKAAVREVIHDELIAAITQCVSVDDVRSLWRVVKQQGDLTDAVKQALTDRAEELGAK